MFFKEMKVEKDVDFFRILWRRRCLGPGGGGGVRSDGCRSVRSKSIPWMWGFREALKAFREAFEYRYQRRAKTEVCAPLSRGPDER